MLIHVFDLRAGQYMSLTQHLVQMGATPMFVALLYLTCQFPFLYAVIA